LIIGSGTAKVCTHILRGKYISADGKKKGSMAKEYIFFPLAKYMTVCCPTGQSKGGALTTTMMGLPTILATGGLTKNMVAAI
jgi:hypothetical protein